MGRFVSRGRVFSVGVVLVGGLLAPAAWATTTARSSAAVIDRAVVAAIPVWQGKTARVLDHLDLSEPFATASQWTLVVARDPGPPALPLFQDSGSLAICFAKALSPQCTETYAHARETPSWYATPHELRDARIVHAGHDNSKPLLLLQTCSAHSGDGNCDIRTMLYAYDRAADRFHPVFVYDTWGSNNNQGARFVEHGPLRGDVIVDFPTNHAPYTYWIEVYARHGAGDYARILRYRGRTGYGDGNALPVVDSEMPEILRRLGYWKPGDALPIPPRAPRSCDRLVLRGGVEWCQSTSF